MKKYTKDNMQDLIKKEPYGIVYKVTNIINKKVYIGVSTIIEDGLEKAFYKRYSNNILNTHNDHLKKSINKYGLENFEITPILDIAYSQEELDELEDMYIEYYNSMDSTYGYNKRGGGSRGRLSKETKKKMSDIWTDEYKKNHSDKIKIKWKDEKYKEQMSNLLIERWQDPNYRDYMSNMSKEKWQDEDYRNHMSQIAKQRWEDDEYKSKQIQSLKQRWENEDYKQNHSNKLKLKWQDEEYRGTITLAVKSRWDDDEYRKKMSEMSKALSNTEEAKEKFRNQMIEYWSNEENRKMQGEKSKLRWQDEEYRKNQSEKRKLTWQDEEYRKAQAKERKSRWDNEEYRKKMSQRRSGAGNSRAIKVIVKINGKYEPFGCKKEAFTSIGVSKDVFNSSIEKGLTPTILKAGVSEIIIGDTIIDYTSKDNIKNNDEK